MYNSTKRNWGKWLSFGFLHFFTLLTSGAFYKCKLKISCAIFKKKGGDLQWYKFLFYCSNVLFTIFQPLKNSGVKSLGFIAYLLVWGQIWLEEYAFLKQAIILLILERLIRGDVEILMYTYICIKHCKVGKHIHQITCLNFPAKLVRDLDKGSKCPFAPWREPELNSVLPMCTRI